MNTQPEQVEDPNWGEDRRLVAAILEGDAAARHSFIEAFSGRLLKTGLRWCRPYCSLRPGQTCFLERRGEGNLLASFLRSDCDEIAEAYTFILQYLLGKALPKYQGRCRLSTYVFALLNGDWESGVSDRAGGFGRGRLFADYVRTRKRTRIRLPVVLEHLPEFERKVFKEMCYGHDDESVAWRLRLPPEQAAALPQIRLRIEGMLLAESWEVYWYWLGHLAYAEAGGGEAESQVEQEEGQAAREAADPAADVEREVHLREAERLLQAALRELPVEQRRVLFLRCCKEMTAGQVADAMSRSGYPMTQRRAYTVERNALKGVLEAIRESEPGVTKGKLKLLQSMLQDWAAETWPAENGRWADRVRDGRA